MEKFDIEKLKRNTPYKLPENTYEDIQRKVLAKTTQAKQVPVYKLKWLYSAAAVILLLIGFGFFINSNQPAQVSDTVVLAKNTQALVNVNKGDSLKDINAAGAERNLVEESSPEENLAIADLTSMPVRNQSIRQADVNVAQQKSTPAKMVNMTTEKQVDNVLDGFSPKEIATLTANTEQDVYLDLYNQL